MCERLVKQYCYRLSSEPSSSSSKCVSRLEKAVCAMTQHLYFDRQKGMVV